MDLLLKVFEVDFLEGGAECSGCRNN